MAPPADLLVRKILFSGVLQTNAQKRQHVAVGDRIHHALTIATRRDHATITKEAQLMLNSRLRHITDFLQLRYRTLLNSKRR